MRRYYFWRDMDKTPSFSKRFENLGKALDAEHYFEKDFFIENLKTKSLKELSNEGLVWYPLEMTDQRYTLGEHPLISLQIDEKHITSHVFRSGSVVQFFQNQDGDILSHRERATIHSIDRNKTKIILDNDVPEWIKNGKIGIIIDFDEKTINEMKKAVKHLIEAKDSRWSELRDIIYQRKSFTPSKEIKITPKNNRLNPSQIKAVESILGSEDVEIIHGPPGTGKTSTIVETIAQLINREKRVLACAPSNSAVDLIVERCAEYGIDALRIGNLSRVNEEVLKHTLEYKVEASDEYAQIKKLRKKVNEHLNKATQFKRSFGEKERNERKEAYREVRELRLHIQWLEKSVIDRILSQSPVICTTLIGSLAKDIENINFDTVIIDEVSQAMEPATWIPISKATNVVLVGDPFQLPPTVKSNQAIELGLSITLLDIAYQLKEKVHLLNVQYRMHESIVSFSNQVFYENKIKSAENTLSNFYEINDTQFPNLQYIDTAGCGFDEKVNENSLSSYNPEEAQLLFKYLNELIISLKYKYEDISIGVISPYREQVMYMRDFDAEHDQLQLNYDVEIATIDSFQGQEKDIIFISLVRSNEKGNIGFLSDYRRMNVAFTRAKNMLVVVGDSATIGSDTYYQQWIDFCQSNGAYRSAWEWM